MEIFLIHVFTRTGRFFAAIDVTITFRKGYYAKLRQVNDSILCIEQKLKRKRMTKLTVVDQCQAGRRNQMLMNDRRLMSDVMEQLQIANEF